MGAGVLGVELGGNHIGVEPGRNHIGVDPGGVGEGDNGRHSLGEGVMGDAYGCDMIFLSNRFLNVA